MKRSLLVAGIAALTLLTSGCEQQRADAKSEVGNPQWDYLTVLDFTLDDGHMLTAFARDGKSREIQSIHELGDEGWELAGILPDGKTTTLYFKRPKR